MSKKLRRSGHAAEPEIYPVAEYVRMSTDHQRYSIESQQTAIAEYARAHQMVVTKTYADPGKSGLTLAGRPGLRALLNDVTSSDPEFSAVLIYDVSRWGRFQDTDESAHYEFLLRSAGLRVIYCAEPFENDGTALSAIMKTIKRTMAGEHSREMSVKIRASRRRSESKGYWHGAMVPFGLRRMCVGPDGAPKGLLQDHQRKHQISDHVVLVPGPKAEVDTVRKVFRLYANGRKLVDIVQWLEQQSVSRPYGRSWNVETVRRMLSNEGYVGTLVRGKFASVLGGPNVRQPKGSWRRTEAAIEPIISRQLYGRVQAIMDVRWRRKTDEDFLALLRSAQARHGRLTLRIIEDDPLAPSPAAIRRRFGGLKEAYAAIGYQPVDPSTGVRQDILDDRRAELKAAIATGLDRHGLATALARGGRLVVEDAIEIAISVLSPIQLTKFGPPTWRFMRGAAQAADIRVILRLDGPGREPLDYLILPKSASVAQHLNIARAPRPPYDRYRHDTIAPLFGMVTARLLEARA